MPGGPGDTLVAQFPHNLDFTTDTTSADWSDLDPDGCCLAGSGPASVAERAPSVAAACGPTATPVSAPT